MIIGRQNILFAAFSLLVSGISFAIDPAEDIDDATMEIKPSAPTKIWPDAGQNNKLAPNYTATVTVYAESEEVIGDKTYTLTDGPTAKATPSGDPAAIWTGSGTSYSITNTAVDAATASIEFECTWTADENDSEGGKGGVGGPDTITGNANAHINLLDSAVEWSFFRTRQWAKDGKEIGFGIIVTDSEGYGLERWSLTGFSDANSSPADPNWQVIPFAVNPNGAQWERTANVSTTTPSKGKVKVEYNDGSAEERTSAEEIAFIDLKLVKIGFGGSGNKTLWSESETKSLSSPHWNDPDGDGNSADGHSHPVAYASDTKLTVSPEWELSPQVGNVSIKIRASGSNSTVIDSVDANLSGKKLNLSDPAEATEAFTKDTIRYWEDFELNLEASFRTEEEWVEAGTSQNQLYVTRGIPALGTLAHTVVHIGCEKGDELTSESEIINAVWAYFATCAVERADGTKLTYYKDYGSSETNTLGLLVTTDGQCGSWARFFMDCLKAQGITRTGNYVTFAMPLGDERLIVKNWTFQGNGTSAHSILPYYGIPSTPFKGNNSYNWIWTEVADATGIPGQRNSNPASWFMNHQMILIDGLYYDPSYGVTYTSQADFENKALAGFARIDYLKGVQEIDISMDLNGDGDEDDLELRRVTLFKKKTSTVETIPIVEDH